MASTASIKAVPCDLALMLAARYKRPVPIILGILVATLANHGIAASLGAWVSTLVSPDTLRWVVAASFIAMGLWILIPDKEDEAADRHRYGAFLTTLVVFFLVEIGDKTQIATVVLAAQYEQLVMVVIGTTLGMLAANVPVVLAGGFAAEKLPLRLIRVLTALLFVGLGVVALWNGFELT